MWVCLYKDGVGVSEKKMSLRDIFCFKQSRERAVKPQSKLAPADVAVVRCGYCSNYIQSGTDSFCAQDSQFCCKLHRLMFVKLDTHAEQPLKMRKRASKPTLLDTVD